MPTGADLNDFERFERFQMDSLTAVPKNDRNFPYGTAGFRADAALLDHVVYRMGFLAAARSAVGQQAVGIMITASHNQAMDNGVKLVDFDGGMLVASFEKYATQLANAEDPNTEFASILNDVGVKDLSKAVVVVGRDTRDSSPRLAGLVKTAVENVGAVCLDLAVCTTPQLHFAVRMLNENQAPVDKQLYFNHFNEKVSEFIRTAGVRVSPSELVLCGANGVGAQEIGGLQNAFDVLQVSLTLKNTGNGVLNHNCGAEFVQKELRFPETFEGQTMVRCAAFDGDADRVVYFTRTPEGELGLIDGDKIACLFAKTLTALLGKVCAAHPTVPTVPLSVGAVQTAYANGASTAALRTFLASPFSKDLATDVATAKTGVKYVHHKALSYDIGIYFESNGHGTVIFKRKALEEWAKSKGALDSAEFKLLMLYLDIFNAAIGDAMTDLLAAEVALQFLGLDLRQYLELYVDLPVVQTKVPMPREKLNILKPQPDHERWLLEPATLQEEIEKTVQLYAGARAFVRPSGTEDIARLYTEARTKEDAQELSGRLEQLMRAF